MRLGPATRQPPAVLSMPSLLLAPDALPGRTKPPRLIGRRVAWMRFRPAYQPGTRLEVLP